MVDNQVNFDLYASMPTEHKQHAHLQFYPGAGHLIEPPYTPLNHAVAAGDFMEQMGFVPEAYWSMFVFFKISTLEVDLVAIKHVHVISIE